MVKHKTIWGGPSVFGNNFGSKIKGGPITNISPFPRDILFFNRNGFVLDDTVDADLHIVADDLTVGSNWDSRVGSYVAALNGQPDIGVETPLYPGGGFSGSGYRNGTSGYGFSDYYVFPDDSQHNLTDANEITYEFIMRVGHGTNDEDLLSRYLFPDYNIRVYTSYSAGSYYINAYVGLNVLSALISTQVEPYTYNYVSVMWSGPNKELTLGINGNYSVVTGLGNVIVPAGPCGLLVGCNSNFIAYMATGQLIEVMRHRYKMTQSESTNRFYKFAGMESLAGELPQYYNRSTRGELIVNDKIYSFGQNFPRINQKGLLVENLYNGFLKNNFFQEDLAFLDQWIYFAGGTSTITSYSDSDSFSQIGGTGFKMSMDGAGSFCYVYQDTTALYQANYRIWVDVWVKSVDMGCYPLLYIYNWATGNYYDITNQVWSAVPVYNTITTSSTNLEKFSFTMVNEGVNASYRYSFQGYEEAYNWNKSYIVYGINDNMSEQKQGVKVNRYFANVMAYDYLRYQPTMVKMDKDMINFSITYQSAESIAPYSYMTRFVFADSAGFLKMDLGTNDLRLSDSGASSAAITTSSYVADQQINYMVRWDKVNYQELVIRDITESIQDTNTCVNDIDNAASYFYIGCNPVASNDCLDAYIKNIKFYDV